MPKKTQVELLQEISDLLKPMSELAKHNITLINDQLAKDRIVSDYIKSQQKKQ